ncbi:hypothetical protein PR048_009931 [Dryococelus australis]|uniref:DUF4817 domain-containing protein n=1 Tax=Dryococelus australis TaxID=614101 RepID=A0ABQ9I367_9NEOP|nr:hypothetical protein PR048_009931 [Dryococelus australis]
MPLWTRENHVHAYDIFVKSGESIIQMQQIFRSHFRIGWHGDMPNRNTILRWVAAFWSKGSVLKRKPPGPSNWLAYQEIVEKVREAIVQNPGHSARQHVL